jgi:hypothetical protein
MRKNLEEAISNVLEIIVGRGDVNIDGEEVKMKMSKKELIEGRKMKNKMEQIMNDIIISGLPFIIVGIIKKTKISDKSERYANENESNHTYIDEDEIRARSDNESDVSFLYLHLALRVQVQADVDVDASSTEGNTTGMSRNRHYCHHHNPASSYDYRHIHLPLLPFCDLLEAEFEQKLTSHTLCFIADASSAWA